MEPSTLPKNVENKSCLWAVSTMMVFNRILFRRGVKPIIFQRDKHRMQQYHERKVSCAVCSRFCRARGVDSRILNPSPPELPTYFVRESLLRLGLYFHVSNFEGSGPDSQCHVSAVKP